MDTRGHETRLPADIDAQPVVQAAAALRPVLRHYHEEIEREQRMPAALVEQMREAGFYRMVIPRALGGLQVDPLTYLRVVELLAEGGGSVGWNLANNSIGQLVTLGLPPEGTDELYGNGPANLAGTAVQGGGQAVPVEGGYRVSGRWRFGSGCQEAAWMLGSFQMLDGGEPRRRPDGSLYWRGVFPRAEAEIVPGSWDVAGLRGTGSFDWTVNDVFLPERRTMVHAGVPLDNQWNRWPGTTYALPAQAWVGPHHSAVITGIARAGIDALIELAGGKQPRGRPAGLLCDKPPGAGCGRAGRCDPQRRARLPQRDDHRAVEHGRRRRGDHARAARPLPAGLGLRRRQRARGDGPGVPARRQHLVQAREPPGRVLARPARRRPDGHDRAGVVPDRRPGVPGDGPRLASALARRIRLTDCAVQHKACRPIGRRPQAMTKRIDPATLPAIEGTLYPTPFDQPCRARVRTKLGDAAGLTQYGVNLLRLPPGAWSSQRHWHTAEDEFVYVLSGEVTLVTDAGDEVLRAGDCAGFKAGDKRRTLPAEPLRQRRDAAGSRHPSRRQCSPLSGYRHDRAGRRQAGGLYPSRRDGLYRSSPPRARGLTGTVIRRGTL